MKHHNTHAEPGCACGCNRRDFITGASLAMGAMAFTPFTGDAKENAPPLPLRKKVGATVRVAFLYPPSKTFAENPDGWWSWPGNFFDAEGRQKKFTAALRAVEKKLGMKLVVDEKPVEAEADAQRLAQEIQTQKPDGLLLVMFYNRSLAHANLLLKTAEKAGIPVVFFIGLGVKHGPVTSYRRPGVYFIQSLDNFDAIEYGLRMINTKKLMAQSKLLSITEAKESQESVESFFGTAIRLIPFARYAEEFGKVPINAEAKQFIARLTDGARENRRVTQEAIENAARAHFALTALLAQEQADGVAMNCLRRGMLKPCISFSRLNDLLIPAACQNDFNSVLTLLLGRYLFDRPGFVHNLCYETEANHYYASHCTCPIKLHGPGGAEVPYLLRRFAHTNEGSCAIQVFWKENDPATVALYYPAKNSGLAPQAARSSAMLTSSRQETPVLDVYAGRVVKSHAMPPAAGCTTNVEIAITDRADVCSVFNGHAHNVAFCGDFARPLRLFANLYKLPLADTGYKSASRT